MNDLPTDVVNQIINNLELASLRNIGRTSKRWMRLVLRSKMGEELRWLGGGVVSTAKVTDSEEPEHLFVGKELGDAGLISTKIDSSGKLMVLMRHFSSKTSSTTTTPLPSSVLWFSVAGRRLLTLCRSGDHELQFTVFPLSKPGDAQLPERRLLSIPCGKQPDLSSVFCSYHIHTDYYILYINDIIYCIPDGSTDTTRFDLTCVDTPVMWGSKYLVSCIYVCTVDGFIVMGEADGVKKVFYFEVETPLNAVVLGCVGYGVSPCGGVVVGISNKKSPSVILKGSCCEVMTAVATSELYLRGVVLSSKVVVVAVSNNLGLPPDGLQLYSLSDFCPLIRLSLSGNCPSFNPQLFASAVEDPCFAIKPHEVDDLPAVTALLPHAAGGHSLVTFVARLYETCTP